MLSSSFNSMRIFESRETAKMKVKHPANTMFALCQLLAITCLMQTVEGFKSVVKIKTNPPTVQANRVDLSFGGQPENPIKRNIGWVQITPPKGMAIYENGIDCEDRWQESMICKVEYKFINGRGTFRITSEADITDFFSFKISRAIDNPDSTAPTRPFSLLTSTGESQSAGANLRLEAKAGKVRKFSLTPKSKTVGESTILEVRIEPGNKIPKGAFIVLSFPSWNKPGLEASSSMQSYIQGAESCNPVAVAGVEMSCNMVNGELVMEGAAAAPIQPGSEIVIEVSGFRNPIESGVVDDFRIQTEIRRGKVSYAVDSGTTSIEVFEYALLSQARIEVEPNEPAPQGVIQSKNIMRLQFYLPVPLNPGCQVTVKLPEQYKVREVKRIRTLNFFGNVRSYTEAAGTLDIDKAENSFKIAPCKDYRDNKSVALIIIDSLLHYRYVTKSDSFQIHINSEDDKNIARIQSGVTFKPKMGVIGLVSASAENEVVSAKTPITFVLQPQHAIYSNDRPNLVIEFPNAIKVAAGNCKVTKLMMTSAQPMDPLPKCKRFNSGEGLLIPDFLPIDYIPGGNRTITVTVGDITNPESTFRMDGLRVVIKAHGQWAIDEVITQVPWKLVTGTFTQLNVQPRKKIAYMKDLTYRIAFSPEHKIPHNGYIEIQFPKEVLIPDPSFSQSQCKPDSMSGFPNDQIICEFTNVYHDKFSKAHKTEEAHTLLISNAFRRASGPGKVEYALELPGLQNPIRTDPTESFKFATFTRDFKSVDSKKTGASIQMMDYAKLKSAVVTLGNYTNSEVTEYTFTLVPTVPIKSEYKILLSFPEQVTLPEGALKCTSKIDPEIECRMYNGEKIEGMPTERTIQVEMKLAKIKEIKQMDRFSIKIHNVKNPVSTETTDTFQVIVVDKEYAQINVKQKDIVITTSNAFTVDSAKVSAQHSWPGVSTEFTIEFTPKHKIDRMGGVLIVYPPQITPMHTHRTQKDERVIVSVDGKLLTNQISQTYDKSARSFVVLNVIQDDEYIPDENSKITLKIMGLKNPYTNKMTDSFKVYTFNQYGDDQFFFIDKADEGLVINSKCQYPCKTCKANEPDHCESCFEKQIGGLKYLQDGKCVKECSLSRFYSEKTKKCEKCDSTCLSCAGTSSTCTDCGIGENLYLHNKKCGKSCPDGYLEDSNKNQCVKCASRCLTCTQRPDKCTSCKQDNQFKLFYKDSCTDKCPAKISVQMDGRCKECDGSCKTCSHLPSQCETCEEYMKLDPIRKTCKFMCVPEKQIYSEKKQQCENCNYPCEKCEGNISKCTSCVSNFLLNKNSKCDKECADRSQVAINGVCKDCEEPCATCTGTTKACSSCNRNYLLHRNSQCVQYCPDRYKNNTDVNPTRCVYEGLVCPKNFDLNKNADGCVPKKYECKEGYHINSAKTACIPEPGSPVPFPFLLSSVFLAFLVLGSYMKDPVMTKPITCLIGLIGPLELILYISMMYNAAYEGVSQQWAWVVFALVLIAVIAAITSNVLFFMFYQKDIAQKDMIYKDWINHFPQARLAIPWVSCIVNYKFFKMFYSGFFGLEIADAAFEKHAALYRNMKMVQRLNFIFTYGFIFVADFIIFVNKCDMDNQLFILCIESIIIQITLIILIMIEMKNSSKELLGVGSEKWEPLKPTDSFDRINVAGGIDNFEDYDEGVPDIDEVTLIRTRAGFEEQEINMRKQALVKILNQVSSNYQNAAQKGADIGGDITDVMTKFEPDKIKLRRAFSHAHNSNTDSWRAEGESSEDSHDYGIEDNLNSSMPYDDGTACDGGHGFAAPQVPERRFSWPLHRDHDGIEMDPGFLHHVEDIKLAAEDYLVDNVYTDVKPKESKKEKRKVKTVSRRTQTYLRELLTLDGDELQESDMEVLMEEEAEIEQGYAAGLINDVIEHLSDEEESRPPSSRAAKPKVKPVVKQKVPDFELEDIMGEFEIDDLGNFIIIRGPNGELMDKRDRRVNRRGYLVDRFGNVINRQGDIIFKAVELDVDDEIPAPFGFEKRKAKLMQLARENQFKIEDARQDLSSEEIQPEEDDEEMLDRELQDIRNQNKESQGLSQQKSRSRGDSQNDEQLEPDEEGLESAIDEATKKKVPRKRKMLRGKNSGNKYNNPPPRRIRAEDTNHLFPMIGIENEEQRRLARIAHSIGGMARDVAEQQRLGGQHQMGQEEQLSGAELEEAMRMDMMRQQQLRELTQEGNIASLNEDFAKIEHERRSFMMQDRPNVNSSFQRIKSAVPLNASGQESFNDRDIENSLRYRGSDGRNELQKVYGNIVDLTNLEEQHLTDLMIQRRGVGQSVPFSPAGQQSHISAGRGFGGPGIQKRPGRQKKVRGLENIYLKKFNKSRMNQLQQSSGTHTASMPPRGQGGMGDPFRPMMHQFEDDPGHLVAETHMSEVRGIEPSVVMADRIDHIKRQYLSSNTAHGMRPSSQAHLNMFGPGGQPQPELGNSFISASIRAPNATTGLVDMGSGSQKVLVNQQYSGHKPEGMHQQYEAGTVSLSNYDQNQIDAVRKDNWVDKQE